MFKSPWAFALLGSAFGGITFMRAFFQAENPAQQTAGATMAMAWIVLPYLTAQIGDAIEARLDRKRMIALLERAHGPLGGDAPMATAPAAVAATPPAP